MSEGASPEVEPQWCLVANVRKFNRRGESGREIVEGTRHFSGGTRVYCFPTLWGDGYEQIRVLGKHRGSSRLVVMIVQWLALTHWRAKLVYKPRVLSRLRIADQPAWSWASNHDDPRMLVEGYVAAMRERESHLPPLDDLTGMEPTLSQPAPEVPGLGGDALLNYLRKLLTDEDRKVRSKVVRTIHRLNLVEAVPMLTGLLDTDPVDYIQADAVIALESIGTDEAVQAAALWRERQRIRRG